MYDMIFRMWILFLLLIRVSITVYATPTVYILGFLQSLLWIYPSAGFLNQASGLTFLFVELLVYYDLWTWKKLVDYL